MKRMRKGCFGRLLILVLLAVVLLNNESIVGLYRELTYQLEEHTDAERQVWLYAATHNIHYGDYPASLIELLERNPETRTFVLEYPLYEQTQWDLSEYENSATVPLFLQWDQRWGYETYGSDCIGITGCGPTCLAMVGYYLTGDERFNPADMANFAWKNGYYSPGNGSSWTLISEGAVKLGLDVTEIPLVKKRIEDNLEVGNPIILAMGPGDFTTTGHYIVLVGMEDGQFRINDPNSLANSQRLWSYEELENQIRNLWVVR